MPLKEIKSTLCLLLFVTIAWGQHRFTGLVTDADHQPLPQAEVYIAELQRLATTSDSGAFSFEDLPAGQYTLTVFSLGFQLLEQTLALQADVSLTLVLQPLGEQLSEVVLTQQREKLFGLRQLKKVEGTAIYAGKKSEVIAVDLLTANLATNNPRQVYSQIAGLNIYEDCSAGIQLNIGGRGLDPNRSANFNIRQNGYDLSADPLGYPESYYTPAVEALSEIQVVRGAASLQYGPQFGGLINFKFKKPNPHKEVELVSRQTLGSFNLFTSFNSLSGTVGKFSYYTYFNYKQGQCFRCNSDYDSRNYFGNFNYQLSDKTQLSLDVTLFNYLAQQPGGLTDAQFLEDPSFSNRERNWFKVDWNLFSLRLNHQFSTNTQGSLTLFALDATRSALGFRTNRVSQADDPSEPRELLQDNFRNWGAEGRVLTRYTLAEKEAVLLLGAKYYQAHNKQKQGPGSAASDPDFTFADEQFPDFERQSQFEFPNLNAAVFGENILNLSKAFSITPGFRFEYIQTESEGSFKNIVKDNAGNVDLNEEVPDNRSFTRSFVLLGLGASYKPSQKVELYANFSQNYRSITFSDIRVVNPSFQVDEDITDESGFTADLGARGHIGTSLRYDLGVFGLLYEDRIGEDLQKETRTNAQGELVETGRTVRVRRNIGNAFICGIESLAEVNLQELLLRGNDKLRLYYFTNLALTHSQYLSSNPYSEAGTSVSAEGNVTGNQVEFVPKVNLKTGLRFGYGNLLGSLQYTYLSEQFTDASNTPQDPTDNQSGIVGSIPAYDLIDLSLSYTFKRLKLEAGINNLLNRSYFTRRATGYPGPGIIPAEPRTVYTTLEIKL